MDLSKRLDNVSVITKIILPECTQLEGQCLLLSYFYGRKKAAVLLERDSNMIKVYSYRARRKLKDRNQTNNIEDLVLYRLCDKINY